MQVELALGDVAGVVGDRVRDIAARHGRHCEDRYRAAALILRRLLVAARELAVEVAEIASV